MPLKKFTFSPGINRDQTNYSVEGGWWAADKVRFLSGFPQKLGGWVKYTTSIYRGVCRALYTYDVPGGYNLMAIGTNQKIYVESGGTLHDITPIRQVFTPGATDSCFTTYNYPLTPKVVLVTIVNHGARAGDFVTFSGVVGPFGGVPASDFNKEFEILTLLTDDTFTIAVATDATSNATGGGNGITAAFQLTSGYGYATAGYGWGASPWGGNTTPATGWGQASLTPVFQPIRLQYFDNLNKDLVYNIRGGDIYYWEFDPGFEDRSVALRSLPNAVSVPRKVTQVLTDEANSFTLAFGCTPYADENGESNPLLIRWCSQLDILNWAPNVNLGVSTAGYLEIQGGSAIIQAVQNYGEILVFTSTSLTSLQFLGPVSPIYGSDTVSTYSQKLISADISLIGPRAVLANNNIVYWMGLDKFYIYNGRVETLPCTLRQHVFDNLNYTQSDQIFCGANQKNNEIWWFYCSANSLVIDSYVIFNYLENIWYYGSCSDGMLRTAWVDSPLRQYPQGAGGEDSYIYNHEFGHDADTLPLPAFIETANVDLDDGDQFVLLRRIIPDVTFDGSTTEPGVNPSVNFTVMPRDFPGSNYLSVNAENQDYVRPIDRYATVPVEQYTHQVFIRARARQMALRVESSGVLGVSWQLGSPRMDLRADGRRS